MSDCIVFGVHRASASVSVQQELFMDSEDQMETSRALIDADGSS